MKCARFSPTDSEGMSNNSEEETRTRLMDERKILPGKTRQTEDTAGISM